MCPDKFIWPVIKTSARLFWKYLLYISVEQGNRAQLYMWKMKHVTFFHQRKRYWICWRVVAERNRGFVSHENAFILQINFICNNCVFDSFLYSQQGLYSLQHSPFLTFIFCFSRNCYSMTEIHKNENIYNKDLYIFKSMNSHKCMASVWSQKRRKHDVIIW